MKRAAVPDKHSASLRARQLDMVRRVTFVMILANLLNASIVVICFQGTVASDLLYVWGAAILVSSMVSVGTQFFNPRDMDPLDQRSQTALDNFTRGALLSGILWGVVPFIVMNAAAPGGQMILGVIVAGMMFAGTFLMARTPAAAISFLLPVGAGVVAAMQLLNDQTYQFISLLSLGYVGVLVLAVSWSYKQFVEQHLSECAVTEQSQLIGLLLRDFEESTSDWLWQTNAEGRLQDIPLVFEGLKGADGVMRKGEPLLDMFVEDDVHHILKTSLMRRQAFRDLALQVKTPELGHECWWSVTGKPIFESGKFRGFRGVATDITQSKEIEDRIAYMAHYDGLTGLPNRITMQEHLEKAVRTPLPPKASRALVWMDLDNFKWVNDTLGHPAGDELLRQVSGRLTGVCRDEDIVSRISGDEFALIVERPDWEQLEDFLDDLVERMSEPYDIWGSTANCSASVGVRLFDSFTSDARVMLKHADLALYQAKKLGKGNWCMFTDELDEKARARQQIETDLYRALDNKELRVFFQPVVDAETLEVSGFETLLRWEHPTRGLVYPGEFIEHAEDIGLITRIGDWVIRAAMAEARRLPDHIGISVNISPLQIHSQSLVPTIMQAIAANNIAPERLELEITESVLMSDTEFTLQRLHQIKKIGVRIALDDFGTGFSSLSYLRSFPFDKIKIDKSFVSDLESRADNRAIAIATLDLARSLGMSCTAEGVETGYQSDFLRENGCNNLQGFFISRAQPLDKLRHLVELKDTGAEDTAPAPRPKLRLVEPDEATNRSAKVS
ncbi:MAG: GGDEF-domain containing protein [Hyphomonas sp.]|jgi:diguanylate cyclase (GGDEF)-like protein/PAS domain S-box-containing protein|nr:GGDEF-domain containing protein [Hyphomonas sp.]MBM57716.1 GGDEF-domain containing protein [Hyphomonas sp.]